MLTLTVWRLAEINCYRLPGTGSLQVSPVGWLSSDTFSSAPVCPLLFSSFACFSRVSVSSVSDNVTVSRRPATVPDCFSRPATNLARADSWWPAVDVDELFTQFVESFSRPPSTGRLLDGFCTSPRCWAAWLTAPVPTVPLVCSRRLWMRSRRSWRSWAFFCRKASNCSNFATKM